MRNFLTHDSERNSKQRTVAARFLRQLDLSVINFGGTLSADLFVILVCDGCTFTAVYNLNIYETAASFDWLASF